MVTQGSVLVISGPSGSGKSTICRRLLEDARVEFSISATTRKPRRGEVNGVDYHFMEKTAFREHIDRGAFIEWAEVHGNLYGTLREPMERARSEGRIYLVEIDVQGGSQLKSLGVPGTYVFIAPPDMDILRRRLVGRGTDDPKVIERRLKRAYEEMDRQDRYDHVVVNDDVERALAEVRALAGLEAAKETR